MIPMRVQSAELVQLLRYIVNGAVATLVHFASLTFLIGPMNMRPVGFANFLGAVVGSVASFVGNRQFVFRAAGAPMQQQAVHFAALYAALALAHSTLMYFWCDWAGGNYHMGFLAATLLQFVLSYIANRRLVFMVDKRGLH